MTNYLIGCAFSNYVEEGLGRSNFSKGCSLHLTSVSSLFDQEKGRFAFLKIAENNIWAKSGIATPPPPSNSEIRSVAEFGYAFQYSGLNAVTYGSLNIDRGARKRVSSWHWDVISQYSADNLCIGGDQRWRLYEVFHVSCIYLVAPSQCLHSIFQTEKVWQVKGPKLNMT